MIDNEIRQKFISELIDLCKKYDVSFHEEDMFQSFVVFEGCDQKFIDWLKYQPTFSPP